MTIELYDLAAGDDRVRFSPYCWRIKMALAHKGLDATTVPVRFGEKDKIAFSGQKLVPVLRHDDTVISDSWDIALYLDRVFPDRPRLIAEPPGPGLTSFVRSWSETSLSLPLLKTVMPDVLNGLAEHDKAGFRESREQRFGMKLDDFIVAPDAGRTAIKQALTPMRHMLGKQTFFCGSEPAFADYVVFGVFMWAHCASRIEVLEDSDPVYAWRERMLDLYGGLGRNAPRNP